MSKSQGWKLPILGVLGILFAMSAVFRTPSTPEKTYITLPPTAPFEQNIAGIGVIEPKSEAVAISSELPGVVREVMVQVGNEVKAGDPLFALDQRDIDAEIAYLTAVLESSKVQLANSEARFDIVSNLEETRAVSKDDYNSRKYGKELAATQLAEIEARLNQAKVTKERLTVRAPIDGQVLELNIRPGEFAAAANVTPPLVTIGDVNTLHVKVEIDEDVASLVRPEMQAKAFSRSNPNEALNLTFVRFKPYIRAKENLAVSGQKVDTRVLQVIYALPRASFPLFVGQQMDVFIERK